MIGNIFSETTPEFYSFDIETFFPEKLGIFSKKIEKMFLKKKNQNFFPIKERKLFF
jgi:hypothetical protein